MKPFVRYTFIYQDIHQHIPGYASIYTSTLQVTYIPQYVAGTCNLYLADWMHHSWWLMYIAPLILSADLKMGHTTDSPEINQVVQNFYQKAMMYEPISRHMSLEHLSTFSYLLSYIFFSYKYLFRQFFIWVSSVSYFAHFPRSLFVPYDVSWVYISTLLLYI